MSGKFAKPSYFASINDNHRSPLISLHGRLGVLFWVILIQKQTLNLPKLYLSHRFPIKRSEHANSNLQSIKLSWRQDLLPRLYMLVETCPNLCSLTNVPKSFLPVRCKLVDCIQSQFLGFWLAVSFANRIISRPLNLITLCCHSCILGEV